MDIPVPFEKTIHDIEQLGYTTEKVEWSDEGTRRNFIVYLSGKQRFHGYRLEYYVCKMALVNRVDKDDLEPLQNYRRALWFQSVLEVLTLNNQEVSFTVPHIWQTNAYNSVQPHGVVWMIMDHTVREMICPTLPDNENGRLTAQFQELCKCMAACHQEMQRITPALIQQNDPALALPEFLPHQSLGWKGVGYIKAIKKARVLRPFLETALRRLERQKRKKILARPQDYALDMGAFERKNFFLPRVKSEACCQLIDCEFATFARRHDPLAKAFIRLWANDQRPDLARQLLRIYVDQYVGVGEYSQFFLTLRERLLPKTYSGSFFDAVDRGQWSRSYRGHILRRELRHILKKRKWEELIKDE